MGSTPGALAEECLAIFDDRIEFVFDDQRALVSPHPVLAEGFGLRPDVLAPMLDTPDRMIVMVPTEEFRQHQIRTLPRASALNVEVGDPVLAQANRVERDRLLAEHAVRAAREHGVHVLEIDGSRDAEAVADDVARHFAAHLTPRTTHLTARLTSKSVHATQPWRWTLPLNQIQRPLLRQALRA